MDPEAGAEGVSENQRLGGGGGLRQRAINLSLDSSPPKAERICAWPEFQRTESPSSLITQIKDAPRARV